MTLSHLHLQRAALSEVEGPLRSALERVLLSGAHDVGWYRPLPIPDPVYVTVQGQAVWSSETGWHEHAEAILKSAAGSK